MSYGAVRASSVSIPISCMRVLPYHIGHMSPVEVKSAGRAENTNTNNKTPEYEDYSGESKCRPQVSQPPGSLMAVSQHSALKVPDLLDYSPDLNECLPPGQSCAPDFYHPGYTF